MSLTMINLSMFAEAKEAQETAAQLDPQIREMYEANLKLADIKKLRSSGPSSLQALLAYMKDKDVIASGSAGRALEDESYRVDASCVEPLVEALKLSETSLEAGVYTGLLVRIGTVALEPVLPLLNHPRELVVRESIATLVALGDMRAAEHLRPLLHSESEAIRQRASTALDKLGA
jgi:HEAT repeat protein